MEGTRGYRARPNDACPCGSGRKFKRCHGGDRRQTNRARAEEWLAEHRAAELRREAQQGLGRPIVSTEHAGYRLVAVGKQLRWGKWKTFHDFLSHYLRDVLGGEWGNAELAKPLSERHLILQWYDAVCRHQRATIKTPGVVHSAPSIGATDAYFGLAYSLYLLAHNVELQTRLLERLRDPDQFRGAYYECLVAGVFVLAGYELALEDESDRTISHCEFVATRKASGNRYSVEAKARAPGKANADVGNQLRSALGKAANHPRIVMIDVNLPNEQTKPPEAWLREVVRGIKDREGSLTVNGEPAPPAFVIVTNHPFHYDLEGTSTGRAALAEGFKIRDFGVSASFGSLSEMFKTKQRYADLFAVLDVLRDYRIPSTFDGEVPEFAFGDAERRFTIGQTYELPEVGPGAQGVLTTGSVVPDQRRAHLAFQLDNGQSVVCQADLSEAEVAAYRSHPATFFGRVLSPGGRANNEFELFEWIFNAYRAAPRETLLGFLRHAPDVDRLSALSNEELLLEYCERCVADAARPPEPTATSDAPPTPPEGA